MKLKLFSSDLVVYTPLVFTLVTVLIYQLTKFLIFRVSYIDLWSWSPPGEGTLFVFRFLLIYAMAKSFSLYAQRKSSKQR